jgi:hypothetical protein
MMLVKNCRPLSATQHSPLGDLPLDLWVQVVSCIDSARSLCMLSMATRGFSDFLSDMDKLWHPTTPTYSHLVNEITGNARPTIIAQTLFGLSRRSRYSETLVRTQSPTREEMGILLNNLGLFDWMPMCLNDYDIPDAEKENCVADILLSVLQMPRECHGRRHRVNAILGNPHWLRYLCSFKTSDPGVPAAIQAKRREMLRLAVRLGDWKVVHSLLKHGLVDPRSVTLDEAEQCWLRYGPGIPVLLMGAGARYSFGEAVVKNAPTQDCKFIFVGKMPSELQRPRIYL